MINDAIQNLPAASPVAGARSVGGAAALTSDFQTFLQMLTAQARYQDPLEPIDSTEYAAQLAQFSMVEQQVQTNDLLAALYGQAGTAGMTGFASWVGMEARAVMPAWFDGAPITVSPNPAAIADEAFLVVTDAQGKEIDRRAIPVAADPVSWDGHDDAGKPFAAGAYEFSVESHKDGKIILSEPAEVYARVTEAQVRNGTIVLILAGGTAIPATAVTALRA